MQISSAGAAPRRRDERATRGRFSVAHLSIVIEFAPFQELEARSPYTKLATNYKVDNKLLLILARQRVVKRMMAACIKLSAGLCTYIQEEIEREKHPA
jgi:hypothetical protein